MGELTTDWTGAAELAGRAVRRLLDAPPGEPEREALIRFLAGRDDRPWTGAFAQLAPARLGRESEE